MKQQMTWAFRVQNADPETLDIDIYDVVGDDFWFGGVSAKSVREKLCAAQSVRKINVRINSAGGDVWDGFAIYNLLREHRAKVTVDIDGLAASIASIIAMAGDKIRIAENAMMMIHNPWTIAAGDGADMRSAADMLDKVCEQIAVTYAARTGQKIADVLAWMDAETWLTASEALEKGFVTEVTPAKQAAAKAFLNLGRFKHAPEGLRASALDADSYLARLAAARPDPTPPSAGTLGGAKETPETHMDPKALEADLAKARAELAAANQTIADRDATLRAQNDSGAAERRELIVRAGADPEKVTKVSDAIDALLERATKAERGAIELEVDALVGDKLYPAERDAMVALAQKDRATFDTIVAARPALNLVGPRKAVDKDAPPPSVEGASAAAGDELSAAAERRANGK